MEGPQRQQKRTDWKMSLWQTLIRVKEQGRWWVFVPLFHQRNEWSKERQFPNFWHYAALGYPLEAFLAPHQSLTWIESGGIMANIWAGVGWDGKMVGGQWQPQPLIHLTSTVLPFTDFTLRGFPTCRLLPYSDRKVNSLTSMAQSMVKTAPSRRRAWP